MKTLLTGLLLSFLISTASGQGLSMLTTSNKMTGVGASTWFAKINKTIDSVNAHTDQLLDKLSISDTGRTNSILQKAFSRSGGSGASYWFQSGSTLYPSISAKGIDSSAFKLADWSTYRGIPHVSRIKGINSGNAGGIDLSGANSIGIDHGWGGAINFTGYFGNQEASIGPSGLIMSTGLPIKTDSLEVKEITYKGRSETCDTLTFTKIDELAPIQGRGPGAIKKMGWMTYVTAVEFDGGANKAIYGILRADSTNGVAILGATYEAAGYGEGYSYGSAFTGAALMNSGGVVSNTPVSQYICAMEWTSTRNGYRNSWNLKFFLYGNGAGATLYRIRVMYSIPTANTSTRPVWFESF